MTLRTRTTVETFERLVKALRENKKLYYPRFGDADFYIMHGIDARNHKFNPKLATELIQAFNIDDPRYMIGAAINHEHEPGMAPGLFAPFPYNNRMVEWISKNPYIRIKKDYVFESAVAIHYLSVYRQDLINSFLDEFVRDKKKMVIANCEKEEAEGLFGKIDHYVKVPARFAYETIDEWYPLIEKNIDDVELCLPFAGQAGRVIMKRLWMSEKDIHCLDLGSIIDAALGLGTRQWIRMRPDAAKDLFIK